MYLRVKAHQTTALLIYYVTTCFELCVSCDWKVIAQKPSLRDRVLYAFWLLTQYLCGRGTNSQATPGLLNASCVQATSLLDLNKLRVRRSYFIIFSINLLYLNAI